MMRKMSEKLKKFLVLGIAAIMVAIGLTSVTGLHMDEVQAAEFTQIANGDFIGGKEGDPLKICYASGNSTVRVLAKGADGNYSNQYFNGGSSSTSSSGDSSGIVLGLKYNGVQYTYYTRYYNGQSMQGTTYNLSTRTPLVTSDGSGMISIKWENLPCVQEGEPANQIFDLELRYTYESGSTSFKREYSITPHVDGITETKLAYEGDTYFSGSDSGYDYSIDVSGLKMVYIKQSNTDSASAMCLSSATADAYFGGYYSYGSTWAARLDGTSSSNNGASSTDESYGLYWNLGTLTKDTETKVTAAEGMDSKVSAIRIFPADTNPVVAQASESQLVLDYNFILANVGNSSSTINELDIQSSSAAVTTSYMGETEYTFNSGSSGTEIIVPIQIKIPAYTAAQNITITLSGICGENTVSAASTLSIESMPDVILPSIKNLTADDSGMISYVVSNTSETGVLSLEDGTAIPVTIGADGTCKYQVEKSGTYTIYAKSAEGRCIFKEQAVTVPSSYMVEHYQENADDDQYTFIESEKLIATVGQTTTQASAKQYEGFQAGDVTQQTIQEDGSTVVKIYYQRLKYDLTFDFNGGTMETPGTSGKVKQGATITAPEVTKQGYTFVGWNHEITTMPAEAVTFIAQWTPEINLEDTLEEAEERLSSFTTDTITSAADEELDDIQDLLEKLGKYPEEIAEGGYTDRFDAAQSLLDDLKNENQDTQKKLTELEDKVSGVTEENVTTANKDDLIDAGKIKDELLGGNNLTAEEKEQVTIIGETIEKLTEKIEEVEKDLDTITDILKDVSTEEPDIEKEQDVTHAKETIDKLVGGNNITTDQRSELIEQEKKADSILQAILDATEGSYDIIGNVIDADSIPAANAIVQLKIGNEVYKTTSTDASGSFTLYNIKPGTYNIVITNGDVTVTRMIIIASEDVTIKNLMLPAGKTNSIVEVKGDADVVADGLNDLFIQDTDNTDDTKGFTAEDQKIIENGGTVEMKLVVEEKDEQSEYMTYIQGLADESGKTIGKFMELSVLKTVLKLDAKEGAVTRLIELPQLITVILTLDENIQGKAGYVVYRYHEGGIDTISEIPNEDGECIIIDGTTLILKTKKFSTYAIGYESEKTPILQEPEITKPSGEVTNTLTETPKTGDAAPVWPFSIMIGAGIIFVSASKKRNLCLKRKS